MRCTCAKGRRTSRHVTLLAGGLKALSSSGLLQITQCLLNGCEGRLLPPRTATYCNSHSNRDECCKSDSHSPCKGSATLPSLRLRSAIMTDCSLRHVSLQQDLQQRSHNTTVPAIMASVANQRKGRAAQNKNSLATAAFVLPFQSQGLHECAYTALLCSLLRCCSYHHSV